MVSGAEKEANPANVGIVQIIEIFKKVHLIFVVHRTGQDRPFPVLHIA